MEYTIMTTKGIVVRLAQSGMVKIADFAREVFYTEGCENAFVTSIVNSKGQKILDNFIREINYTLVTKTFN